MSEHNDRVYLVVVALLLVVAMIAFVVFYHG